MAKHSKVLPLAPQTVKSEFECELRENSNESYRCTVISMMVERVN